MKKANKAGQIVGGPKFYYKLRQVLEEEFGEIKPFVLVVADEAGPFVGTNQLGEMSVASILLMGMEHVFSDENPAVFNVVAPDDSEGVPS